MFYNGLSINVGINEMAGVAQCLSKMAWLNTTGGWHQASTSSRRRNGVNDMSKMSAMWRNENIIMASASASPYVK